MIAAHGRGGPDAGRHESFARLRTLRFAGQRDCANSIYSVGRDALIGVNYLSMLLNDAWRFVFRETRQRGQEGQFWSAASLEPLTCGSRDRGGCVFGGPRRGGMIWVNKFCFASGPPR